MQTMITTYIINRLLEASTIRGIILSLFSAVGYSLSTQQTDYFVFFTLTVTGLIGTIFPDKLIGDALIQNSKNFTSLITPEEKMGEKLNE